MSNEFPKFVAGVRLHARAADSRGCETGMAWRGSPARTLRARRLREI